MARVEINQKGIDAMFAQVGERLKTTTERVVRETKELPAEEAAQRLQKALAQIGVNFDLEACRGAVDTMRRGEKFTFHLR
jgi:hypothetical protein